MKLAIVTAYPRILATFAPLVLPRPAQMVRLGIQQRVQRLLHRRTDHLVQMRTDLPIVNLNHSAKRLRSANRLNSTFHRRLHHKSLRGLSPLACTNRLRQNSNQMCE